MYAQEYDPARTFLINSMNFLGKTPWPNLINGYASLVRSDYVNHAGYLKDCYLIFNADKCENVLYGAILAGRQRFNGFKCRWGSRNCVTGT